MRKANISLFFILAYFTANAVLAQFSTGDQKKIDSLNAIIANKRSHDTSILSAYVNLSDIFYVSNPDTLIPICKIVEKKANLLLSKQPSVTVQKSINASLASALNNIGVVHQIKGEMNLALAYYLKSLNTALKTDDKQGIAATYNNIGHMYSNLGDIPLALLNHNKGLKIFEEIDSQSGIASSYGNIAVIYNGQGDTELALKYLKKSLKIREKIDDKKGLGSAYNNIGVIFRNNGNPDSALTYFKKSLKIREEIGDKKGMAICYNNIGATYKNDENIDLALQYHKKSLEISQEIGNKSAIAYSYNSIGILKLQKGEVKEAKEYGKKGLALAKEIGFPESIKLNAQLLYDVAQKEGNYKDALEMRNLEIQMRDSIASETNIKASANQQSKYEYEKEKALTEAEQAKKDALALEEKQKQQLITYGSIAGLVIVLLFLFVLFKRFKITQKQKAIIERQKHIVDEKQKEILDSIHYAKRIQMAMLTSEEYISHHFKAEFFILFQPKDVVSGDFYWATQQHNKFYIATADCTGHGVPGAFMSLLNISFLNENVIERKLENPAQILNEQRKEIIKALNPKGNENSKDGMDCVLCSFDLYNNKLDFAAANNPLWLVRKNDSTKTNELIEYKGDKMPVGKYNEKSADFTPQQIDLQKGDIVYTFTDGYADQFGGNKGKKFMYKKLKDLLIQIAHLPMDEQKKSLNKTMNDWKGNNEQVDDILIIGVRI